MFEDGVSEVREASLVFAGKMLGVIDKGEFDKLVSDLKKDKLEKVLSIKKDAAAAAGVGGGAVDEQKKEDPSPKKLIKKE